MGGHLTLQDLLDDLGVGARVPGAAEVELGGVAVDSRLVAEGDLFVALPGQRTDGHRFVAAAFEAGARAALVSRRVEGGTLVDARGGLPPGAVSAPVLVLVEDTLASLQRLAAARRRAHPDVRVVGVTGSLGKTTAKEAIAAVLARRYRTLKSEGNQNNEIGLPLTLMRLRPRHERAVLEMGMYALGEIAELCRIAVPQVGVVTNVGPVHLERLGTVESVARAKAELVAALPPDGAAVLSGDDPRVAAMAGATRAPVVTYGLGPGCDVRAARVESRGLVGVDLDVEARGLPGVGHRPGRRLRLRSLGAHSAMPALAAVAVGLLEGLGWEGIQEGLDDLGHGPRLVPRPGVLGTTVLDDAYNASPASTLAALDALAEIPGRHVVALGDMLELGAHEREGHLAVGRRCAEVADVLLAVGPLARTSGEEAIRDGMDGGAVRYVDDAEEAARVLPGLLRKGDVVLVKGSRGVGLERVVDELTEGRA